MPVKTIRSISHAKDLHKLYRIIHGLVGQECWKAEFIYGGELCLHFGARVPCDHPKMAGEEEGAWIFGTCGTEWTLDAPTKRIPSTERNEERLERNVKRFLEGNGVSGFEVGKSPAIAFSNGCRFSVVPTIKDDKYELPYWELFTPRDMLIAFGPGDIWSYTRSDVPES